MHGVYIMYNTKLMHQFEFDPIDAFRCKEEKVTAIISGYRRVKLSDGSACNFLHKS